MRNDFAIFILSHGRANKVKTLKTLKDCGYNGKWYIIIDNEDKTYHRADPFRSASAVGMRSCGRKKRLGQTVHRHHKLRHVRFCSRCRRGCLRCHHAPPSRKRITRFRSLPHRYRKNQRSGHFRLRGKRGLGGQRIRSHGQAG